MTANNNGENLHTPSCTRLPAAATAGDAGDAAARREERRRDPFALRHSAGTSIKRLFQYQDVYQR